MESIFIRFARTASHVADFSPRLKLLTQKLLKQGYRYHKLHKTFSKFYRRYYDLISKFQIGIKSFLHQGLLEPEFYGDLVYKLTKIIGSNNIQRSSLKWFSIIKRLAITLKYCNRLRAWWSTQSQLATLLSSLIARRWVGLETLWRFRLKDVSIDEMVETRNSGCCQAHRGSPVGFLLLLYSGFLLLSPYFCFISFLYD